MLLKGERISLRAVEPGDADIIHKWENTEGNWQLSNTLTPFSKHTIKQYVETAHKDIFENKQVRLMIETIGDKKAVGAIDLFDFDPFHQRAGLGILINDLSERKKGYASEALDILIRYTKQVLILRQIYCNIGKNNTESIKLFESKGFVKTGEKKEWQRISQNKWEDVLFYQKIF